MDPILSPIQFRAANPATQPQLTDALRAVVARKRDEVLTLLRAAAYEFRPNGGVAFATSLGAEDQVLTDIILGERLPIAIFSLDTGRLPSETYAVLAETEARHATRIRVVFPEREAVEAYVEEHGINGFYDSIDRRKACCAVRKVAPLRRALAGRGAWVTGLRAAQAATRSGLPVRQFDDANGLVKFNPLADWSEQEVWAYIRIHNVPYSALHDQFYPSIGCAPCTRAVSVGDDVRAGRWWWEAPEHKECGLHPGSRAAA